MDGPPTAGLDEAVRRKKSQFLSVIEPSSIVTILTELLRLFTCMYEIINIGSALNLTVKVKAVK
jgi:hypothetical protein